MLKFKIVNQKLLISSVKNSVYFKQLKKAEYSEKFKSPPFLVILQLKISINKNINKETCSQAIGTQFFCSLKLFK